MLNDYEILPESAPLYPKLPYLYKDYEKISVFCDCNPAGIRALLPSLLEPTSNVVEFFVLKNHDIDGIKPYSEGGMVIPCKYNGITGGHVAFEWVTTDEALCAGREIWGYPKKIAEVDFSSDEKGAYGKVIRNGEMLFEVELSYGEMELTPPSMQPRLVIKRILNPHDDNLSIDQIIINSVENSDISKVKQGNAQLKIYSAKEDPISLLNPLSVVGGQYTRGEFTLTYGKILKDLLEEEK